MMGKQIRKSEAVKNTTAAHSLMLLVIMATVVACGEDGTESPSQRLIGDWINANSSDTAGVSIIFTKEGTYFAQLVQITSNTSGNDEIEEGIFSATDTEITLTPQRSSCPGPSPIISVRYGFSGESLVLNFSTTIISFSRKAGSASGNFTIAVGCFQDDGSFVRSPLSAVSN